jgi:CRISPR-associated protein Cas2
MWIVVMFDLPTDTKAVRRQYTQFHKSLLKDGFVQMQYSVYIRHCSSKENTVVHAGRVKKKLPPYGEVRVLTITDKQFEKMQVFFGKRRRETEKAPLQLEFF